MPEYLSAPVIEYDAVKVAAFESLAQTVLDANGGLIDYALPYPKYEFLSYLADHKDVILHGSPNSNIDEFKPIREGMDSNPHGNVMGVYGTADGIWPMFFAILCREAYKGSMRNGVGWEVDGKEVDFTTEAARQGGRKRYVFSLNAEQLDKPIWQDGMLYILPRTTFEQQRGSDGLLTPEWASLSPVKPLARLVVTPDDFPFLHQVSGHDDFVILRMQELIGIFSRSHKRVNELADGYAFEYDWSRERAEQVVEFADLSRQGFPVCTVELTAEAQYGPVWVRLRGPETFKNVVGRELKKSVTAQQVI